MLHNSGPLYSGPVIPIDVENNKITMEDVWYSQKGGSWKGA